MSAVAFLGSFALLLEFVLLMTALGITLTSSVAGVIQIYFIQSLILAFVTGFTAYQKLLIAGGGQIGDPQAFALAIIALIPLLLGLLARWLLLRATRRPEAGDIRREAERTWRDVSEQQVRVRLKDVMAFVAIIALAALVATRFHFRDSGETIGLTVSLTLHLVGLYIMTSKRDLMSQTVGLLVMDHGLYLAVVKIVAVPVPAIFFVVGLLFYTIITVLILMLLVPQVRRKFQAGIDLGTLVDESELKG